MSGQPISSLDAQAARDRKIRRNWAIAIALVVAVVIAVVIHVDNKHDASFNAGAEWARQQLPNWNPDSNTDPCKSPPASASVTYEFSYWVSGCESVVNPP